jgi:hypothetical protein
MLQVRQEEMSLITDTKVLKNNKKLTLATKIIFFTPTQKRQVTGSKK